MRIFLILLFSVTTFYAYSQVSLPNDVARFFLEQHDKVKLLETQVKIKESIINKKDSIIVQQGIIIDSYKGDSLKYEQMLLNKDSIITNKDKQVKILTTSLNRTKLERDIAVGVGGGVIIGLTMAQPLIGGIAGGIIMLTRRAFKK